ncbi:cobalamin biosynthesis protein CbiM [Clostridium polyendosporum]|uniref:Cobalamin biosynthesis protein CbiM n=1 Tax=Clostridium polyendosporum TaxID=69208 RepID=A0A919S4W2_9CLOT|nr:energy-coupling factor ABC transporter permease [Clostridium polyendosporum]GIM30638.1 cobalamin biosynthesis protein CbiM [Clostridium polyendosporum]
MHMADALISPVVGSTMLVATGGVTAYSIKRLKIEEKENKLPLMGVMGAFVFTAQMINFSIPGTGSSGHLAGGLLLAALLGPYGGFLTMLSILLIQSLVFGDGGLLALGCNVINLGFMGCIISYPLIYKRIITKSYTTKRIFTASIISSVVALQLGAFSVVIETLLSGVTQLPFSTFAIFMQPIHLLIGIVEGVATGMVINFVWKSRPDLLEKIDEKSSGVLKKNIIEVFLIVAMILGGVVSWFASEKPDGLEWSVEKTAGVEKLEKSSKLHNVAAEVQDKIVILPDYNFKSQELVEKFSKIGTSVAGIVGMALTAVFTLAIGFGIKKHSKRKKRYKLDYGRYQ